MDRGAKRGKKDRAQRSKLFPVRESAKTLTENSETLQEKALVIADRGSENMEASMRILLSKMKPRSRGP